MPPEPNAPASPEQIAAALALYGLQPSGPAAPVVFSVRNENFRVPTEAGPFFVRFHRRSRSMERLRREHRVIHWAAEHGLPVVPPLRDRAGETLAEVGGRVVAVFPWIDGASLQRGRVTVPQAAAMGGMHGRLHAALADYADETLPWFWGAWQPDVGRAADLLAQYAEQLPSAGLAPDEREIVEACLRQHLERLRAEGGAVSPSPDDPGVQPVHGDYHERNVLLDAHDAIVAVVDWDMVNRMPRVFELVRCLTFADLLEPPLLDAYLTAYRRHTTLSAAECAGAVELWWEYSLRDTWLYRTRIVERDAAVQPFFAEHVALLDRFGDPAFRAHLAGELRRLAGPDA
jgi:Ser/Thr protein kinase RdoA (MazF antagonist)